MSVVTRVRTLDPLTLGPALWLDDSGSDKSVWPDKSGFGRNAVQATTSAQPDIITNALNGKQVRRFNATSSQFFDLPSISAGGSWTAFGVYSKTSGQKSILLGKTSTGTSGPDIGLDWTDGNIYSHRANGTYAYSARGLTSWRIFSAVSDSASSISHFLNGSQSIVFYGTAASDANFTAIARRGSDYTTGDIAEIIVYPYALTSYERQLVEGYLSYKYALPVS